MVSKRKFSKEFKSKVALAALKEDKTMSELSAQFDIHANMIGRWAKQAKQQLPEVFANKLEKQADKDQLIEELYQRIGQLSVEGEWLKSGKNRNKNREAEQGDIHSSPDHSANYGQTMCCSPIARCQAPLV